MKALAITGLLASLFGCQQNSILVEGHATAHFDPDYVSVTALIVDNAQTSGVAAAISAKHMNGIVEGLKAAGFDDLKVTGFNIYQHCEYERSETGKRIERCAGFDASNRISVRLADLSKSGLLLGTLSGLAVDRVEAPEFGVNDQEAAVAAAREKAIGNARASAGAYAKRLGRTVGGVIRVEETSAAASYLTRYGAGHPEHWDTSLGLIEASIQAPEHPTIVPLTIEKVSEEASVYAEFELR